MTIIEAIDLSKEFNLSTGKITALPKTNLRVSKGEFLGIYGVSGSGKTTLLNLIGLLDTPSFGDLLIDGINTNTLNEKKISEMRNIHFGFLHQSFGLLSDFTALENIEIPLLIQKISDDERISRCKSVLKSVGLHEKADFFPAQLSGGQQQRVALARALVTQPMIILADEPTGALDLMTGKQIVNLLRNIAHNTDVTVIMVTHDRSYHADFDRILNMNE